MFAITTIVLNWSFGMNAVDLRQQMIEEGEDDPKIFPEQLDIILRQTLAFRCKGQPKFRSSSVTSVDADIDFIQSIAKIIGLNERNKTHLIKERMRCSVRKACKLTINRSLQLRIMILKRKILCQQNEDQITNI